MGTFFESDISSRIQWLAVQVLLAATLVACGGGNGSGGSSSSGATGSSGAVSSGGGGTSSSASSSTSGMPVPHDHNHCVDGFAAEPTDATMATGFAEYTENGQTDATVQPEVIAWMEKHIWQEAHFIWHEARRCGGGGFAGGFGGGETGAVDPCSFPPERLPEENECAGPQDGYEFLVMHRHMLYALRDLWPGHEEQFAGWEMFPDRTDYPDLLHPYFRNWSEAVLSDAALADSIDQMTAEEVLALWPTEGHFGQWIQCGSLQGGLGGNSLHGALHFNGFPPNNQTHSVANQRRNLDSYLFWKLHGWIDSVWEKYRHATGLTSDDPRLADELQAQCEEMHFWAEQIEANGPQPERPIDGVIQEAGYFHERVRPALERAGCATCHGAGEEAGLRLGYEVSSTEIVQRLVNAEARNVEGYRLVVPGDPENSWLYLKASGLSVNTDAICRPSAPNTCRQAMPNSAMPGLTEEELQVLRQWILDGAPLPDPT